MRCISVVRSSRRRPLLPQHTSDAHTPPLHEQPASRAAPPPPAGSSCPLPPRCNPPGTAAGARFHHAQAGVAPMHAPGNTTPTHPPHTIPTPTCCQQLVSVRHNGLQPPRLYVVHSQRPPHHVHRHHHLWLACTRGSVVWGAWCGCTRVTCPSGAGKTVVCTAAGGRSVQQMWRHAGGGQGGQAGARTCVRAGGGRGCEPALWVGNSTGGGGQGQGPSTHAAIPPRRLSSTFLPGGASPPAVPKPPAAKPPFAHTPTPAPTRTHLPRPLGCSCSAGTRRSRGRCPGGRAQSPCALGWCVKNGCMGG